MGPTHRRVHAHPMAATASMTRSGAGGVPFLRRVCGVAGLVLGGLLLPGAATAAPTTIYSEAPPYASLGDYPPAFPAIGQSAWAASNFVTDGSTSGSYQLTVRLGINSGGGSSESFFAALYGNSGPGGTVHYSGTGLNSPGSLIAALSGDSDPDSPGVSYYDYSATVNLAASTNYWVVVGTTSSNFNEYSPMFGRGIWPTTTYGARLESMQFSPDQGASWATGPDWRTVHLDMAVSVDSPSAPVPEPGTWALMLAGAGALALRRRPAA